jgi:hypothetical protein
MILDDQNIFSNRQQLLASAPSTNIIDLGATGTVLGAASPLVRDISKGVKIPLLVQVTESFAGATSLDVALESSDDPAFASDVVTLGSQTIPGDQLTAGARWGYTTFPYGTVGRYLRLNYTVTGGATAGRVTAGVTMGNDETYPL